ncbi:MAG: NADP-dependent isocitrate dehydrogenase, partial [Myxococcota bacterium]
LGEHFHHAGARLIGAALDEAAKTYLLENKSPSRKVHELDNRGSHYYLATFWAKALAEQSEDADLAQTFASVAHALASNEEAILRELHSVQGPSMDIGGYYMPNDEAASKAMRPSATLNRIIDGI